MNFKFFKKDNIVYIIIIVLFLIIGYQYYENKNYEKSEFLDINTAELSSNKIKSKNSNEIPIEKEEEENKEIIIHISGAVKNPGILKMDSSKRIVDAVELAGGATNDADLDRVNLAAKLHDEEKVYIPKFGEENSNNLVPTTSSVNSNHNGTEKININSADSSELQKIPGIGEKTAQKIIDYRSNNPFSSIEDIKNIDGIGDKKFESMKEYISIY